MNIRSFVLCVAAGLLCAPGADAQFRRGMFGEGTEITLYPLEPPALVLPAGSVRVEVRNASNASARILETIARRISSQLTDNDSRLDVVSDGGSVVVVATLTGWEESRRNSTKYVSETRQVGTRQVTDKDGKTKTEPVYEYGRNRPSVVINAAASIRVEVQRTGGGALADETARHTISEEYLLDAGPPSREEIEDLLIDGIARKAAGRISPGRQPATVRLARSDDVDRLNTLAQDRKWDEWLTALEALKPHSNRTRDSYRLHNLAVAHEALAYESTAVEDWMAHLRQAGALVSQAVAQNPKEKYFNEAAERIARSQRAYQQLAELYKNAGLTSLPAAAGASSSTRAPAQAPAASGPAAAKPMTNQDVIDLRVAGLDDKNLMAAIADAPAVKFDLSPAGLKALLQAKVSNQVIAAMRARMP